MTEDGKFPENVGIKFTEEFISNGDNISLLLSLLDVGT